MQQSCSRSSLVASGLFVGSAYQDGDRGITTFCPCRGFGPCPSCSTVSRRVHNHYRRRVNDPSLNELFSSWSLPGASAATPLCTGVRSLPSALPTTYGSCTGAEKSICFRRDESARTKWSCTGQSKYCRPNNRRWKNGRCGQDRGPAFRP